VDEYVSLAKYLLYHHERWDGKGYPEGLSGDAIPLQARIIAVADAYEAMTASRPYQKSKTTDEAKAELRRCAGTQFDPEVVRVFLQKVLS
jgi:HD-GYP domain-containing protein (c-di-GMP phosphodiesterase class II)